MKQGLERDFGRQVLAHLDPAYRLALALCRSPSDAEDLVQDAVLRALRGFDGLAGDDGRAWLLRIVRHCFYTSHARRRRDVRAPWPEDDALPAPLIDADADPARATETGQTRSALAALLDRLSPEHREVLVLREVEDLDYREIASITGLAPGTVMSRLARARAALRRLWHATCGENHDGV